MSRIFGMFREFTRRPASVRRVIFSVAACAIPIMFATRPTPDPVTKALSGGQLEKLLVAVHSDNPILFNLAIGYIISAFFWWLVVDSPEKRRRTILRNNLARRYSRFKETIVFLMLSASNCSVPSDVTRRLASDHLAFRAYFDDDERRRFYAYLNALSDPRTLLADTRYELDKLRLEIEYVLGNVQIDDASVHDGLKRYQDVLFALNNWPGYQDDPAKYIGRELWGMLARFSFSDGYVEQDFIETLINRIK